MLTFLKDFCDSWRQWHQFSRLPHKNHRIVVYSEGAHDWPHIGPILEEFLRKTRVERIAYLSSARNDPGLALRHPRYSSHFIGSGSARTLFFEHLDSRVVLLTLPDIDSFHIRRNTSARTHYVYCFHSINSTHAVYRRNAFASYDTIFCVGPHHVLELRREEELTKLPARRLVEHGSVKLDGIRANYARSEDTPVEGPIMLLLAPSWGVGSFIDNRALSQSIIAAILQRQWHCRVRLHPMTVRHRPQLARDLERRFRSAIEDGSFAIETDMNDNNSLRRAHLLISDWSGVATEFAFGLERPVLFIDTAQKINNPEWGDYELPCIEKEIRHEIGEVLSPSDVGHLTQIVETMTASAGEYRRRIVEARTKHIFNVGRSAEVGAQTLIELLRAP